MKETKKTPKTQLNLFERNKSHKESTIKSNLRAIDLFAGIGGIRQGFEKHGCKVIFSAEWDKHAQLTYELNYKEKDTWSSF